MIRYTWEKRSKDQKKNWDCWFDSLSKPRCSTWKLYHEDCKSHETLKKKKDLLKSCQCGNSDLTLCNWQGTWYTQFSNSQDWNFSEDYVESLSNFKADTANIVMMKCYIMLQAPRSNFSSILYESIVCSYGMQHTALPV